MKKSCLAVLCAIGITNLFGGHAIADPVGVEALLLSWGPALPYTEAPGQTVEFTKDKGTLPGKKYSDGHVTIMKQRVAVPPTPNPISGHLEILSFVDVFSDITLDTGVVITLSGQGTVLFTETDPLSNLFEAEILSFELSTSDDPLLLVRESPTRQSLGTLAVLTALSLPGTPPQYQIDSFFDVFTELSDDGGLNWDPADLLPGEADVLPLHVTANGVVPEPASLCVLSVGVMLLPTRSVRFRKG